MSIYDMINDILSTLKSLDINESDVALFACLNVFWYLMNVYSDVVDGKFDLNLNCLICVNIHVNSTLLFGSIALDVAYIKQSLTTPYMLSIYVIMC